MRHLAGRYDLRPRSRVLSRRRPGKRPRSTSRRRDIELTRLLPTASMNSPASSPAVPRRSDDVENRLKIVDFIAFSHVDLRPAPPVCIPCRRHHAHIKKRLESPYPPPEHPGSLPSRARISRAAQARRTSAISPHSALLSHSTSHRTPAAPSRPGRTAPGAVLPRSQNRVSSRFPWPRATHAASRPPAASSRSANGLGHTHRPQGPCTACFRRRTTSPKIPTSRPVPWCHYVISTSEVAVTAARAGARGRSLNVSTSPRVH
ncbi:hypothetical protein K466DRAFT_16119 [Polyporus arcularius HHB13444]|uniref:Uncharacterized protein n=1 Tax=Polyporus arcularius HHB13444 TaxID=1314778 RepID=A0A5C3NTY8_9APHY|nr:hypothetical protein K466DRAFT_16119 [Polyporus arcularius HHB13444]